MKTFVIAEAGANHNRDFEIAKELIDVAVESKSDAVKFQTYSSETLYAKNTPDFAGYKNINQLIKDIELPREWQKDLKSYCDEKGIEFMSTPFDEQAVQELVDLGVKRLKIAGFEATDPRFVEMVASTKLPIIMSVGIGFQMNYMGKFLDIFERHENHVTLLHCNNAYPTPMEDINLKMINLLSEFRGVDLVGLSDHTMSTMTPALAVAAGAQVIEKHYTLSRTMEGPDHPFAMEPDQLCEMVQNIREAEKAMNTRGRGYSKSEESFSKARRSVVTSCDLKKGDILSEENITTKRPLLQGTIPALDYYSVMGYPVVEDIKADTPINKSSVPHYYETFGC
jgi:N,N'-diacetyllegionaminate synthase